MTNDASAWGRRAYDGSVGTADGPNGDRVRELVTALPQYTDPGYNVPSWSVGFPSSHTNKAAAIHLPKVDVIGSQRCYFVLTSAGEGADARTVVKVRPLLPSAAPLPANTCPCYATVASSTSDPRHAISTFISPVSSDSISFAQTRPGYCVEAPLGGS
ncbi:hypothetical protein [Streptomyces cellostaticus]|uniref:hypothetical protein n=1 Tax=Streptomyces cellostaticus TaxID=67285 RepID=UPI00202767F1|nr:hypothetical protein [Streptomyces cellostaticus]